MFIPEYCGGGPGGLAAGLPDGGGGSETGADGAGCKSPGKVSSSRKPITEQILGHNCYEGIVA